MNTKNKKGRRKNRFLYFFIGAVILLNIFGCDNAKKLGSGNEKQLVVYVPSGIFAAFSEISDMYKKEYPDAKISFDTDDSVVLMRKIRDKNYRPDIFIANGPLEMMPLLEKKLIVDERVMSIANDSVILVTPASNPKNITRVDDLAKPEVESILILDPKINSSGMIAVALLRNQNIWDKIKDKVVFTEFGRIARNSIVENKADAAIMPRSCLYEELKAYDEVRVPANIFVVEDLMKNSGTEIQFAAGVITSSKNKKLAEDFIKYMASESAQAILKKREVIETGDK